MFAASVDGPLPDRLRPVTISAIDLPLRYPVPPEIHLPVETAPRHVRCGNILEGCITYDVDDRTYYSGSKKRLNKNICIDM